jgi:glycosyltransferase involved in cell wall biosynthesis
MMAQPLVSCIMPTKNRRDFIPAAIDCWQKQTYKNRELVIVDDGEDCIEDLVPKLDSIWYIRCEPPTKFSTGTKRNYCNELARGSIICHFDDDDWSAPDRIENQVETILECGKSITGFGTMIFWKASKDVGLIYRPQVPNYVCGTSLCYLKEYWSQHQFPNKQVCEDNAFVYPAIRNKELLASQEFMLMVARIHNKQTSIKSNITELIDKSKFPEAFWENERLVKNELENSYTASG